MSKTNDEILLGFSVQSGHAVRIPVRHMAVVGQTQQAGKTTALEALITRSHKTAIAFLTKRGESGFTTGREIPPFFSDRGDWEFVESILESTMRQRMKFERAWIVRACEGASTLADVRRNLTRLQDTAKRSMDKDIYMLLAEYLDKVLPIIATLPKGMTVDLQPGALNVMNLVSFPDEMQQLIVASVMREIHKHRERVITVIPEAWKFVPQGRKTPSKIEAEKLAREGAALGNYVWLDAQDIAGVDTVIRRAISVWLIGVQREAHEIKRALAVMPAAIRKPKPSLVQSLRLGEFFACVERDMTKTYAWPLWMREATAIRIAKSNDTERAALIEKSMPAKAENQSRSAFDAAHTIIEHGVFGDWPKATAKETRRFDPPIIVNGEDEMNALKMMESIAQKLDRVTERQNEWLALQKFSNTQAKLHPDERPATVNGLSYDEIKSRLLRDIPSLFQLVQRGPVLEVVVTPVVLTYDDSTIKGRIVRLLADGFFDQPRIGADVTRALKRAGMRVAVPNVYRALNELAGDGAFVVENKTFQRAPGLTIQKRILD